MKYSQPFPFTRFVAEELALFLSEMSGAREELSLGEETIPLGFTFSFPCEQQGLDRAVLHHWTKVPGF